MTTTDRVTAVIDNATRAHNAALAAVITQARSLTDEEAEALAQRLQEIPEIVLTEARRVIDYAALDQSATTGGAGHHRPDRRSCRRRLVRSRRSVRRGSRRRKDHR